jgi:uncharacterized protein DUF4339
LGRKGPYQGGDEFRLGQDRGSNDSLAVRLAVRANNLTPSFVHKFGVQAKSMTAQDLHWYIARDGQQYGPISDTELNKFVQLGHLQPDDLLWRDGLPSWCPALGLLSRRFVAQQGAIREPSHSRDELAVDPAIRITAKQVSTLRSLSANSLVVLLCAMAAAALYVHFPFLKELFLSP